FFKNKTTKGYDVKYQLVAMGPEYATKKGQEKTNPVMQLMEQYAKEVRDKNFRATTPRGQHQMQVEFKGAHYVGSDRCESCHKHEYKVWEHSAHAHAFKTLEDAKGPSLREFDPECIKCHTVGFDHKTGYLDTPKINHLLRDVGCESCHGPASEHIKNPKNKDVHKVMNPFAKHHKPATMTQQAWEVE